MSASGRGADASGLTGVRLGNAALRREGSAGAVYRLLMHQQRPRPQADRARRRPDLPRAWRSGGGRARAPRRSMGKIDGAHWVNDPQLMGCGGTFGPGRGQRSLGPR